MPRAPFAPHVALCSCAGALSLLALAGWALDTGWLPSVLPGLPTLHPFALPLLALLSAGICVGLSWQATAARRVEAALTRSEMRFRHLLDGTPSMVIITDAAGRCTYTNATLQRFTGLDAPSLLGDGWAAALHPDEAPQAHAAWRQAVRAGTPWETQQRFRRRDGAYVCHLARGTPVRSEAGELAEWLVVCTDIQELADAREALARSNADLQATVATRTAEVMQLQKIDMIGHLTAGVAHDFNNLLQPILGSFELLQRRLPAGDHRRQHMIDTGLQSTARAAALVQRLLAFARRQDPQPRVVDVGALLRGLEALVRRSLGDGMELTLDVEPGLRPVRVDPNQLELAILNLAVNARDAMPDGGVIGLSATCRVIAAAAANDPPDALPPGRYACIRVVDTGIGMDAATLARAAEPFFSTKLAGRGTGLGLSTARALAVQAGGTLQLTSAPRRGTEAEIWLPCTEEAAVQPPSPRAGIPPLAASATVLLVDDEPLVRVGTTDVLTDIGYSVIQAASGAEAARHLRDPGVKLDIMVTDYLMPGINGATLAAEAANLRPGMPVLLVTGYATGADGPASLLPHLAKPFRQAELAAHVARLLHPDRADAPAAVLGG
jgi:PAS domain S-box-containing protein